MSSRGSQRFHAVQVATAATAMVALLAMAVAVSFNLVMVHRLVHSVDARLKERLSDVSRPAEGALPPTVPPKPNPDLDEAPTFVWRVDGAGMSTPATIGAPTLPTRRWNAQPVSLTVAGSPFRLMAQPSGSGWVIVGVSVKQISRLRSELIVAELVLGALLMIVTFGGSLVVGLRASAPIEQIRRRQSEFTADASHELRTPLSVIEAEVDLALSRPRDAESYRATLGRVAAESARLRTIIEDLLWLARADADTSEPSAAEHRASERVDLVGAAETCLDRFGAVADSSGVSLRLHVRHGEQAEVSAPPESIDRLIAVLVDNGCRYASANGVVSVTVDGSGHRVTLTVEDTGPGIPDGHRALIFDRFHRATDKPGGTGLGLAIADVVVRSTGGTWSIGRSALGGASMSVSWRHAAAHPSGQPDQGAGMPIEER